MIGHLAAAVQRRVGSVGERTTRKSELGAGPRGASGRARAGRASGAPATRMRPGVAAVAAVREVDAMAGSAWVSKVSATGHQARGRPGRADCDLSCLAEASARGPVEAAHGPRGEFRGVWPARRAWLARSRDSRALGGDGLKVKAASSAPGVATRLLRYWSPGLARSPGRSRNGRPGPAALLPAGFGAATGTAQVAPPKSL